MEPLIGHGYAGGGGARSTVGGQHRANVSHMATKGF